MKLTKATTGFIIHKSAEGKAQRTLTEYQRHLTILADRLNDPDVAKISTTDLRAFLDYLRHDYVPTRWNGDTSPLSPKTLRNIWITLRSFYTWAIAEFNIDDALKGIKAPEYQLPTIDPCTEADLQALLKYAKTKRDITDSTGRHYKSKRPTATRDVALLLFLLDTGVRVSECARLTIADVDLKAGTVVIKPHNSGRKSKPRHTYLGKTARRALWRYLAARDDGEDPHAPLFVTISSKPMTKDSIRRHISRLGQRAGILKPVYPHKLRHTFALNYLRNAGDIYTLQRILGHTDLAMCRRYLAIVRDDVASAHRRASPADNWNL